MKSLWQKEMTKAYGSSYSFLKYCDKRHNKKCTNFTILFPASPFYFIFYQMIIVVFCQASAWISHRYTYILSLLNPPPHSLPIPPLWLIQSHTAHSHWLAGWLTHGCVSVHVTLSTHLPSPLLSHGRTSVFYVCFSTAALEVNSSVPFF